MQNITDIVIEKTGRLDECKEVRTYEDAYRLVLKYGESTFITEEERVKEAHYTLKRARNLRFFESGDINELRK